MIAKKRCGVLCDDCPKNEKWKLVDADSEEAHRYQITRVKCCPYLKKDEDDDCDNKNKCVRDYCHKKHETDDKCTIFSVVNPTTQITVTDVPNPTVVDLTGWTDLALDALESFDNATGTYTVPESGDYAVKLTVSFSASTPLQTLTLTNNIPFVEIYDVDTNEQILASSFTAASIALVALPSVTVVPTIGQVIINTVVPLIAFQRLRVRINLNNFAITGTGTIVFNAANHDTTLSISKERNTPVVQIKCCN